MLNNKNKVLHIILSVIGYSIFIIGLIRVIFGYNKLPNIIGMHFGGDGSFDMYDSKLWILYPLILTIIFFCVFELVGFFSKKVKTGLKIKEENENKIKSVFLILLDVLKLCFSFFFSGVWVDCLIKQKDLNTIIPIIVLFIIFISFIYFAFYIVYIKIKDKKL